MAKSPSGSSSSGGGRPLDLSPASLGALANAIASAVGKGAAGSAASAPVTRDVFATLTAQAKAAADAIARMHVGLGKIPDAARQAMERTATLTAKAGLANTRREAILAPHVAAAESIRARAAERTAPLEGKALVTRALTDALVAPLQAQTRALEALRRQMMAPHAAQAAGVQARAQMDRAASDARTELLTARTTALTARQDGRTDLIQARTAHAVAPLQAQLRELQARSHATTAMDDMRREVRREETEFNRSTQRGWTAANTMYNLGLGNMANATGGAVRAAHGLEGLGFARGGAMLGRVAPVIGAAVAGVDMAAKGEEIRNDPFRTQQEKGRMMFREMVPGGAKMQGWYDAFSGRQAELAKGHEAYQQWQAQTGLEAERRSVLQPAGTRMSATAFYAATFNPALDPTADGRLSRAPVMPRIERTTATGEREFREQSKLLPIRKQMLQVERDMAKASAERRQEENNIKEIAEKEEKIRRGPQGIEENARNMPQTGPERQWILNAQAAKYAELDVLRGQKMEAQNRWAQAKEREGQLSGQQSQLQAETARARAGFAEERASTTGSTARRMGMMSAEDRALNKAFYEVAKKAGPEGFANLPDEFKQRSEAYAPLEVGKLAEEAGTRTEEFKAGQHTASESFGAVGMTPEKYRQEAAGYREQGEVKEFEGSKKFAEVQREVADDLFRAFSEGFRDAFRELEQKVRNMFLQMRGQA